MSKRRINPATGQLELTYREEKLVDEYIKNGGNGKQAAIAAGYGAARADQSAYQVLRRTQIQQHIRDRISESRVSTEEIIGTLVSCLRGNLAQCLNDDGDFDIKVVNQKRLGHLLKTISGTTRRIRAKDGGSSEVIRNYRVQLHSPLQAASILARLKGLHRGSPESRLHPEPGLNSAPASDIGSRRSRRSLAARDSGPQSYDSDPDLHIIQERIDQHTSIPNQGSRLQIPDPSADSQLSTSQSDLPAWDSTLCSPNVPKVKRVNVLQPQATPADWQPSTSQADLPAGDSNLSSPNVPTFKRSNVPTHPKHQHWQPFRRVTGKLANLRKINCTQYLNPARRSPGGPQPNLVPPTETAAASP